MVPLSEPIFDPKKRRDVMTVTATLDFDPSAHTTCESAAKALYMALRKTSESQGQDPDAEVHIRSPEESGQRGWYVSWESGPYDWAIGASFKITGPGWYTEPYYGFDLTFVEN